MIYSVVLAFGDSLTFGARDRYGKGYPHYLYEEFKKKTGQVLLYANEGLNQETIASACKRAYPTLLKYPMAAEVIFFEGTNDSKPIYQTPLVEYRTCIGYISDLCGALGRHLYLPTLPSLKGFGSQEYDKNSFLLIDRYNDIIKQVADENEHTTLIDLSEMKSRSEFFIDAVHCTTDGYRFIAEKILSAMLKRRNFE